MLHEQKEIKLRANEKDWVQAVSLMDARNTGWRRLSSSLRQGEEGSVRGPTLISQAEVGVRRSRGLQGDPSSMAPPGLAASPGSWAPGCAHL